MAEFEQVQANVPSQAVIFAKIQILCGMHASSGNSYRHKPLVALKKVHVACE